MRAAVRPRQLEYVAEAMGFGVLVYLAADIHQWAGLAVAAGVLLFYGNRGTS